MDYCFLIVPLHCHWMYNCHYDSLLPPHYHYNTVPAVAGVDCNNDDDGAGGGDWHMLVLLIWMDHLMQKDDYDYDYDYGHLPALLLLLLHHRQMLIQWQMDP